MVEGRYIQSAKEWNALQQLHDHFNLPGHAGFSDFDFMIIDQGNCEADVRKREMFWQYKLNTFLPNGLNDREVDF